MQNKKATFYKSITDTKYAVRDIADDVLHKPAAVAAAEDCPGLQGVSPVAGIAYHRCGIVGP